MRIVSVIPIKLNNERLPGKNTRILCDKPLINYIQESLLKVDTIDERYVFCSDESIKDYLLENICYLQRDKSLDLPTSNFTQIFMSFSDLVFADVYIYAHATAPFVSAETINKCIDAVTSGRYDSAFCAMKLQDYLWDENGPINFDATNLPRTQDLPVIYQETSGVYVFTKEVFKQYHRRVGVNPFICEVSSKEAIDIDTIDDFEFAEMVERATNIKG